MNKKSIKINRDIDELFKAFSKIESVSERQKFFFDLLTTEELNDIARRWKVANMLFKGVSFADIEAKTGMSSTTIARISKWLKKGYGGMQLMVKKAKK